MTASIWTSDTDDAQSSATSDFQLYDGSSSNGFWFSCNYQFNKLTLYNSEQVSGTYGAAYEYWNASSTWAACSLISSANFGAATATRTVEFNWPSDWAYGDSYFTGLDDLANHFIFRCRLSTGPSASFFCGSVVLEHTQYLTQVMDNDRPQAVAVHNRRVHLAAGNNVYLSQYASPGGYELKYAEYFLDGGREISQMVPYQDYLVVLKENALYGFYGNSLDTWVRKRLYHGAGAISRRSAAQVKNNLYWVARDGIYQWDGVSVNKVSRHIQNDFDGWVATTSVGIEYNGEYWVSFPSSTVTLRCDPDTFRTDDTGEGRISLFKNTLGFTQFLYNRDRGDDGYLYGAVACTATGVGGNHLCRLEAGHTGKDVWCGSVTAIDMIMQTGYKAHESWGRQHRYTRILPRISQVATASVNLMDRGNCDSSGTSPMIFGEITPSASNCTWGFTATGPYEGVGQYRFTKDVAAGARAYLHLVDSVAAADIHGLTPGAQHAWGGRIKVAASASCGFQGFFLYQATTGGGTLFSSELTTATTGWQEVWVTATVYAAATTARIGLMASSSLATMSFDVDNLYLYMATTSVTHALMANNSSVTATITQILNQGSGYDQEYYSIPYTLDGKNLSYYFRHNEAQTVQLAGITFEAAGRYL